MPGSTHEPGDASTTSSSTTCATLVWLANLAALELHTPQWQVGRAGRPGPARGRPRPGPAGRRSRVLPGGGRCCATGSPTDGLQPYPKTSGKKGMQLCCPIAGTQTSDVVSDYAKRVAEELEQAHPKLVVSQDGQEPAARARSSSTGARTTRPRPRSRRTRCGPQPSPTVSTPLTWDEVEAGAAGKRPSAKPYTAGEVLRRVEEWGDLLAPLLDGGPELPGVRAKPAGSALDGWWLLLVLGLLVWPVLPDPRLDGVAVPDPHAYRCRPHRPVRGTRALRTSSVARVRDTPPSISATSANAASLTSRT